MVDWLRKRGFQVTLAHYMPYSLNKSLSVPLWHLFLGRVKYNCVQSFGDVPTYEIGCYLPELEWMHYIPNKHWRSLIKEHDFCISVSGSILACLPAVLMRRKCIAWVATPYLGDRIDRIKKFPLWRKFVDRFFDYPIASRLERWLLAKVNVLALSNFTKSELLKLHATKNIVVMPMAVDSELFNTSKGSLSTKFAEGGCTEKRIGFAGRFTDPRKNIFFLLDVLEICRKKNYPVKLELVGDVPTDEMVEYIRANGLEDDVIFFGHVDRARLIDHYSNWDLFIIPSKQEGLAIVGLEAMACGCPVVSTKCGGPEDYIVDGINGALLDFDPNIFSGKIISLLTDNELRIQMGCNAINTVQEKYTEDIVELIFWKSFSNQFLDDSRDLK